MTRYRSTNNIRLLAAAATLGALGQANAAIWYVKPSGANGNGTSWAQAFNSFQNGLNAAVAGDQIWVQAGTYLPSLATTVGDNQSKTFKLKNGVGHFGGFNGTETMLSQRNPTVNVTILSGDQQNNDPPNFTNLGLLFDNSYHVVTADGTGATTSLDGFTITKGAANGDPDNGDPQYSNRGGGLLNGPFNGSASSLQVRNCIFSQNYATQDNGGAGAKNDNGSMLFVNTTFINNKADQSNGGGFEGGTSSFINCRFVGNHAQPQGGGIHGSGGLTLINCVFSGNVADHNFDNGDGAGGGAHLFGTNTVTNCTFVGNAAMTCQGCVDSLDSHGGGLYYAGVTVITNSIFWANTRQLKTPFSTVMDQDAQVFRSGGAPAASFSIVQNLTTLTGMSNLSSDPLLVDANGADNVYGTSDDNPSLTATSPAIDNGNNTVVPVDTYDIDGDANTGELVPLDVAGMPRFFDVPTVPNGGQGNPPIIDRGAYESQAGGAVLVNIASANPPIDNPFIAGTQPFRDVLQTGTGAALTQGIGGAGTPAEDAVNYATVSVTFSGTPSPAPSTGNVTRTCTGGTCPTVTAVTGGGAGPYMISLSGPIPPGHCTTFTFAGTNAGQKLQYQSLPGDAAMNGASSPTDVTFLVLAINNGQATIPANRPRYDMNRNGGVAATDVQRLVQLLNGLNTTQVWTGVTVANCP